MSIDNIEKMCNIDDVKRLVDKGYGDLTLREILERTFKTEYCTGCSIPASFPDGKCRGCAARKKYLDR